MEGRDREGRREERREGREGGGVKTGKAGESN